MAERERITKIVLAGGVEITVPGDANKVRRLLSEDKVQHGEPFTHFKTTRDTDAYVAVERVAYIEQVEQGD